MGTIFTFTTNEVPPVEQAGGKALALIQMTGVGMPVPPGFVLSVKFFEPWLDTLKTTQVWAKLIFEDMSEIRQAAQAIQTLSRALQFNAQQQQELDESLQSFREHTPGCLYAVRSSSPEEDLEGASFAGGYETSLGVTFDAIPAAIRHSFASSFDERVFLYKREHGFRLDQPRIAVIVQQQIDADSAGVAFSLNPLNNCYDEAMINANHGLGESVVAGNADPDVFIVDKLKQEIIETRTGSKQTVVKLNPQGGTSQLKRGNHNETALSPAQVLQLTALLTQVEAYYQKPVDIEWASANGVFYLLQARPITTYLPLPEEMITASGQPRRLYANSALIEQGLQEPMSVLGTDFLSYVLKKVGGQVGQEAVGVDGMTFTAGGGYYMNLSYALKLGMGKAALAPGSIGDPQTTAILDSIDLKPYLAVELPKKLRAARGKIAFGMIPLAAAVLKAYLRPEHTLREYQVALPDETKRFETFSGAGLSLKVQALELSDLLPFFYGKCVIPMTLAAQIAQQRIRGLFKSELNQVQDHLTNLGVALPGNKTTEMGECMYALASSPEVSQYVSAADFGSALQAKKLSPEFMQAWEKFMAEFGARCPAEIDAATPRPQEQPALFFEQLKNMSLSIRSRSFFEEARAKRETAYRALYETALKKGRNQAKKLESYYKTWLTFGGYRETGKHYVVRVVALFRRQALEIAQTFVRGGRLDNPEQIFDLTIADIDQAKNDLTLDLRKLAQKRAQIIHKIRKSHRIARIIDSRGKIYLPPRKAVTEGELSGIPISPGTVRGQVKVFQHAHEKQLLPGEILVARATDPGWTPLFINAGGILLEIGGALQHGAVVAREYGIPCVSGLDDITHKLADGQWVEVDGSNGIIHILESS